MSTDVSEEHIISTFSEQQNHNKAALLPATCFMIIYFLVISSVLKMETTCSTDPSIDFQLPICLYMEVLGSIRPSWALCLRVFGSYYSHTNNINIHSRVQHPVACIIRVSMNTVNRTISINLPTKPTDPLLVEWLSRECIHLPDNG
jgi:hypothetical protein